MSTIPFPTKIRPMLATLGSVGAVRGAQILEIKFDGYRLMARIEADSVRLFTRGGHDWAKKLPSLASALRALELGSTWIDGEIVVLNAAGQPDFNALQNSFRTKAPVLYYVFDLPFFEGRDLRREPLTVRRELLAAVCDQADQGHIRLSAQFDAPVSEVFAAAAGLRLEGIMAKRSDSLYVEGRSKDWIKLKCRQKEEFVVIGWADRDSRAGGEVGALILGTFQDGILVEAGSVGTGWDSKTGSKLKSVLVPLEVADTPVGSVPGAVSGASDAVAALIGGRAGTSRVRWASPSTRVLVSFAERTRSGQLRHAVFIGFVDR